MRPTKHERLIGCRAKRWSELDLPTKEEMRQIDRWLSGKPDRTELPKTVNIDERKRKNRVRAKANKRRVRWQKRHRKEYNAKMRAYRQRKAAVAV